MARVVNPTLTLKAPFTKTPSKLICLVGIRHPHPLIYKAIILIHDKNEKKKNDLCSPKKNLLSCFENYVISTEGPFSKMRQL